ncbi:MAG: hypothetical protein K6U08_06615 [Firmicutes bacterium]|nr:hypothetical protein [Bacillota bacterium]
MSLQRKLTLVLAGITAVGVVVALVLSPTSGRPAVLVMVAGGLGWFVVMRVVNARYSRVLSEASRVLGLQLLSGPQDDGRSELISRMKMSAERDVFRWKVDGKYPALAGEFEGLPVVVRVPVGVAFDAGAPDSTRIAAYHSVKMTGFTVYDRSKVTKPPQGRTVATGDPDFDARFLVLAHKPEEALAVLGPEVRRVFLEAGSTGFRGVEVNRYGVFLHEEGKVSSADLVRRRLELVVRVARAVREALGTAGR